VTLIAAISPPGGDFSEPVTQAALRVSGALWALDAALAHQRQFPAVDWETSYSLYAGATLGWLAGHTGPDWAALREDLLALLAQEAELKEIAGLVGSESLQDRDRLLLETARAVREAVLAQSAYDPNDAASPLAKTYRLASLARDLHRAGLAALEAGAPFEQLPLAPARQALASLRGTPEADLEAAALRAAGLIAAVAAGGSSS